MIGCLHSGNWIGRLFGATVLAALCGCGGAESQYNELAKTQTDARGTLEAQGAKISSKFLPVVGESLVIDLSGSKSITDGTFEALRQTGRIISELDLSNTNVNDSQLAILNDKELSGGLARLNLSDTEITDKGLENITLMGFLGELNLKNSKVTSDGIKSFLKARAENPAVQSKRPRIRQ
ncbi:MAG: hypothetical protein ACT4QC_20760 [Planctomycetaceae bacterium]